MIMQSCCTGRPWWVKVRLVGQGTSRPCGASLRLVLTVACATARNEEYLRCLTSDRLVVMSFNSILDGDSAGKRDEPLMPSQWPLLDNSAEQQVATRLT